MFALNWHVSVQLTEWKQMPIFGNFPSFDETTIIQRKSVKRWQEIKVDTPKQCSALVLSEWIPAAYFTVDASCAASLPKPTPRRND